MHLRLRRGEAFPQGSFYLSRSTALTRIVDIVDVDVLDTLVKILNPQLESSVDAVLFQINTLVYCVNRLCLYSVTLYW